MSKSNKSTSWDHIDLRGRKMLHPPWTPAVTSAVAVPAATSAVSRTSFSSTSALAAPGRKQLPLRQPPQTLQEILTAFLAAGGSSDQLCSLLNDHMPSPEYIFDPADLRDPDRVYSLEFYFYFFTFCKILVGDPGFRYSRGDEQLDIHHYILEKGKLDHPPWKVDGSHSDGYLSTANIRAIFVFVENAFQFDGRVSGEHTGRGLAREVLSFMNRYVDEAYRVDRAFFNKEEVLVSFEYLFTITSIFELLMNTPDLISAAYQFGTLNNHHLAQAVFLLAGKSPSEKMEEWVRRTNDVYDFEFFEKKQSLEVRVDATRIADSGVFGIYEANCFRGIKQAFPAIFSAFIEIATEKKNRTRLTWSEKDPYTFKVRVSWGPSLLFYFKAGGVGLLVTALGLFLQKHWNGYIPPLLTILLTAAFSGAIGFLFTRYTSQKRRNEKTKSLIFTQLNSLQTVTRELMEEKKNLNETVETRTKELQNALEQLKSLDQSKTNFIANVSHELRTPLSLISIPLEEIQKGLYGEQISRDDGIFKLISRNTLRLQRQIRQLLDFTKLDLDEQPLRLQPLRLPQYCKGLLVELDSLAASNGVSLAFENPTGLEDMFVEADISLLETLLLNLLCNGIKFARHGRVTILLTRDLRKNRIKISVKDTGIGFSEELRHRLFDRFYQVEEKENRKFEGTGLGLALVKKISDLHNWKIEAEGIPGQGACFTLTLPLSEQTADSPAPKNEIRKKIKQLGGDLLPRDKAAGPASGSASDSSAGSASAKHEEKILIIDDNPDMASILKDILAKEYPVEWSPGGKQALRQLLSDPGYALVICDMMMPEMSGLELRKEFLKTSRDGDIPFIFLTALADPHIRQQALETGGVDYITKPFSSEELKLKIRNLIETGRHQYKKAVRDIQGAERLMKFHELDSHIKNEHVLVEYRITKAEKRILNLLKQGLQDKEIADAAGISPRTVSTHLRNLYKKTGTQNRLELINKVFQ